jgi:hypothetical protein
MQTRITKQKSEYIFLKTQRGIKDQSGETDRGRAERLEQ